MNSKFLYLAIDILSVFFPLVFSFHRKIRFDKEWQFLVPAIVIPAVIFAAWDVWFTSMGIWGFNPRFVTGLYIGNLPVEEVLFFICVPYACVFTYECVNKIAGEKISPETSAALSDVLAIGLIAVGGFYYDRWYTSVTFISAGLFIAFLSRILRVNFLGRFYFAFVFILIPFFIVNGILTGTALPSPVVWYKNLETMRIRMGTIPVEDTFYGMLLLAMNISLFEYFRKKKAPLRPGF